MIYVAIFELNSPHIGHLANAISKLGNIKTSVDRWITDHGRQLAVVRADDGCGSDFKAMHELVMGDRGEGPKRLRFAHLRGSSLLEGDGVGTHDAMTILGTDPRVLTPRGRQAMRGAGVFPCLTFNASTFGGRLRARLNASGRAVQHVGWP